MLRVPRHLWLVQPLVHVPHRPVKVAERDRGARRGSVADRGLPAPLLASQARRRRARGQLVGTALKGLHIGKNIGNIFTNNLPKSMFLVDFWHPRPVNSLQIGGFPADPQIFSSCGPAGTHFVTILLFWAYWIMMIVDHG